MMSRRGADHHSGQRLLERPHMKASQRCALDHFSKTVKIFLALRAATTESVTFGHSVDCNVTVVLTDVRGEV